MSADSSEEQKKNGRGGHPNSIAAGTRNLIPYKPGQSGNPGGVRRGTVFISEAYKRLLKLDEAELAAYRPKNAGEAMARRQVIAGIYGLDALPAIKEITDRTEGKAIQRRIDLTEADVLSRARMGYASLQRFAAKVAEQYPLVTFTEQELIEDVLAGIDEQYHEAVIRELEAMG